LDAKYLDDKDVFRKNADSQRGKRENDGADSMYSRMQPFYRPELQDLLDRRIDVLVEYDIYDDEGKTKRDADGEKITVLRWCQGLVTNVYEKNQPTVRVLWDATEDVNGGNKHVESNQWLLPSKWNKDGKNAWRLDIDISVLNEVDDEDVVESEDGDGNDHNNDDGESDDSNNSLIWSDNESDDDQVSIHNNDDSE
jgi:hypothetical protein